MELEGERVALPAGIDLAAYRVVQEALGSAAEAGATTASVVIAYGDDELRLEIRDDRADGEPEAEQRRRARSRERLGLYGGRLRASRRRTVAVSGCWRACRWKVLPHERARRAPAPDRRPRRWDRRSSGSLSPADGPLGPGRDELEGPPAAEPLVGLAHDPAPPGEAPAPDRRGRRRRGRRDHPGSPFSPRRPISAPPSSR